MWDAFCFIAGRLLFAVAWLATVIVVVISFSRNEKALKDSPTTDLFRDSLEQKWVEITQEPGRELKPEFKPLPSNVKITNKQYKRFQDIVRQFVAAANWGLGRPFRYDDLPSGGRRAVSFDSAAFEYKNPFNEGIAEERRTPIRYSTSVVGLRRGWRVIARELSLFLRPDAPIEEAKIMWSGAPVQEDVLGPQKFVARRFRLESPDGSGLLLSVGKSADAREKATTLQVEVVRGEAHSEAARVRNNQYFIWQGQPFAVYETTGANPPSNAADLVITKHINGELTRLHTLGAATANLIGARWRGDLPYLDGALNHQDVDEVSLTLDPDLQGAAYFMLKQTLTKIDGLNGVGRPRRGSVAILDSKSGAIRALAGYPSYDTDGTETRRILSKDDVVARNPALEPHMVGSSVKVLTVALGYLIYGQARAGLLPKSINHEAVRQAFQDAYGVALTEPLIGDEADVTPEARKRFEAVGGPNKVQPQCVEGLEKVFLVSVNKGPSTQTESIISPRLEKYFRKQQLEEQCYPYISHWPIKDAQSMDELRLIALGAQNARLTTLRLAAILGVASGGQIIRPFIIESLRDRNGNLEKGGEGAVQEINLPWDGLLQNRANMIGGMRPQLEAVVLEGGTGSFYRKVKDSGVLQYLGVDDPDTVIDEDARTHNDFGKSGTAPYEAREKKAQDSIFVYSHGDYLIAVWLEQSDKGKNVAGDERFWFRHPAHLLTHRLVQVIEALESQPSS